MTKKEYAGYEYVENGVCAAQGFTANGLNCGINPVKTKNDLGMIFSEKECTAAAVYTQNKVKGAPILVTKANLAQSGGKAQAVIVNSKNANTCNANGVEVANAVCKLTADELGITADRVIVASTGVIGAPMSVEPFANAMHELAEGLSIDGHDAAAKAIMTTDTVQKEVAVEFLLDGKKCRLGGMAKGSGMIHPNMATTLNFITTDVAISGEMIQAALSEIVKVLVSLSARIRILKTGSSLVNSGSVKAKKCNLSIASDAFEISSRIKTSLFEYKELANNFKSLLTSV